jgi:histidine triad (HIT) family protein
MPDTIFDQIVSGEAPAYVIAEDEHALAFLDIAPATPGHTLVIPKRRSIDLFDISEEDLAGVMRMAKRVAHRLDKILRPAGVNLVQSSRAPAGQEVQYFHVHVIPRFSDDRVLLAWKELEGEELGDLRRRLVTIEE